MKPGASASEAERVAPGYIIKFRVALKGRNTSDIYRFWARVGRSVCEVKSRPRAFGSVFSFTIYGPNPPPTGLSSNKIKGVGDCSRTLNRTERTPNATRLELNLYLVKTGSRHSSPRECYRPWILIKTSSISRRE